MFFFARLYVQIFKFLELFYRVPKLNQRNQRDEYCYLRIDNQVDRKHRDANEVDKKSHF